MTDRELLELAAKAAGIEVFWLAGWNLLVSKRNNQAWNPLTDDGDALRLPLMPDVPEAAFGNTAATTRRELQDRGEHPAPCARQCEAQAFRGEIAAEQRRSEMYADLVRRTAEALGLTREDGWHKLPERVAVLCDANERFGQRQEWWTEQMFALEQERDALKAEVKALREACADICDQHASVEGIAQRCAAAIRARGQKESPPV